MERTTREASFWFHGAPQIKAATITRELPPHHIITPREVLISAAPASTPMVTNVATRPLPVRKAKQAVKHAACAWIENLGGGKPEENQERKQERRAKGCFLFFIAPFRVKGDVDQDHQEILGEINHHVVAQILAYKILEEQPAKEDVEALTPVS